MGVRAIHSAATRTEAVRRVEAGESRRAVARSLGISDATVGRWCNLAEGGKLDRVAGSPGEAAEKGWVARRARIAENWVELATACQELALRAVHVDLGAPAPADEALVSRLRLLGGSSPLKAVLTSAAIATDKALLMANEATVRTEAVVDSRVTPFTVGMERLEHALDEVGPCVDDPIMERLFDEMERHLLAQAET